MVLKPRVSTQRLDHHGIVAGVIGDLGLVKHIDGMFPQYGGEEVTTGQAVAAMIINGLGFTDRALSLTEDFFQLLPTEKLLGAGVTSEHLNRHKLSRTLDRIYSFGSSCFFSSIAGKAVLSEAIDTNVQSLDTSSFSCTGKYDEESDVEAVSVARGFSKDHRPDLNQIVAELIVVHDGDVPLVLKTHDGNASDSVVFKERCDELKKLYDGSQTLVADSKLYCAKNADNLRAITYVTRIPESLKEVQETIRNSVDSWNTWYSPEKSISFQSSKIRHYEIYQIWHICVSPEALKRAESSTTKNVEKERVKIEKALFHLQAQRFNCLPDAMSAYEKLGKNLKFHSLDEPVVTQHKTYVGRGKPAKDAQPKAILIQLSGKPIRDSETIERRIKEKACFVIGTNNIEESAEQTIATYKSQASVERGFRFLKEPAFFAQSFYLKKPERLEALITIMTLCLLVYTIAQRRIRKALEGEEPCIPNSSKKMQKNPTLKRIFQIFQGITFVYIDVAGQVKTILEGLNSLRLKILDALGGRALEIYSE